MPEQELNGPAGLLVASGSSHAGKTSLCLALTEALKLRGYRPVLAKAGPDFIDASYHAFWTGQPVANLDPWMLGKRGLARLWARVCAARDSCSTGVIVVEGAMGLFDGGSASAAQLAQELNLAVLIVLDVRGMAESAAALAEGFLITARRLKLVTAGIVYSHVGSLRHAKLLERSYREGPATRFSVPLLGLLPRAGAPNLRSRHLGLVSAEETLPNLDPGSLAAWCEENLDLELLLKAIGVRNLGRHDPFLKQDKAFSAPFFSPCLHFDKDTVVTVAIARDAAFSFCYADLPAVLAEYGARTVFFSPLRDGDVPDCDGLILPGGYPELYAQSLSSNISMLNSLRRLAQEGLPIYAECGGFIYLLEQLSLQDGSTFSMLGLLPGSAQLTGRIQSLGHRQARGCGWPKEHRTFFVRGHEFHYARLECPEYGDELVPLWQCFDREGEPLGRCGLRRGNVAGSWLHLSPEGGRAFFRAWTELLQRRAKHAAGRHRP